MSLVQRSEQHAPAPIKLKVLLRTALQFRHAAVRLRQHRRQARELLPPRRGRDWHEAPHECRRAVDQFRQLRLIAGEARQHERAVQDGREVAVAAPAQQ